MLPVVVVAPLVIVLLIMTSKIKTFLKKMDWKLFGLFVIIALATWAILSKITFSLSGWGLLFSAIGLSQIISNVPATFILSGASDWRILALGVNIGGSGTIISSIATLIAYRYAKRYDRNTSIADFMKWGAFICIVQTAIAILNITAL